MMTGEMLAFNRDFNKLKVSACMTPLKSLCSPFMSAKRAREFMAVNKLSHLPVTCGGKLLGTVSQAILLYIASFTDQDLDTAQVKDFIYTGSYVVSPNTPLLQVCDELLKNNQELAVVENENGSIVGIFVFADSLKIIKSFDLTC